MLSLSKILHSHIHEGRLWDWSDVHFKDGAKYKFMHLFRMIQMSLCLTNSFMYANEKCVST